jgi:hypothetical protein
MAAARERGCSHVDVYRTDAGPHLRQLRLYGFAGREERIFQVLLPEDGDEQQSLLLDPSKWDFNEGDKDSPTSFTEEPQ